MPSATGHMQEQSSNGAPKRRKSTMQVIVRVAWDVAGSSEADGDMGTVHWLGIVKVHVSA